jgi:hypothetical protein
MNAGRHPAEQAGSQQALTTTLVEGRKRQRSDNSIAEAAASSTTSARPIQMAGCRKRFPSSAAGRD